MVTIWEERLREGAADPSRLKDRVRGCSTGRVSRMRTRIGRVSRLEIVPDLVPSLRERYTLSCPVYLLGAGESLRQEVRARARRASRVYRAVVIGLVIFIVGVMGMVSLMSLIGVMGIKSNKSNGSNGSNRSNEGVRAGEGCRASQGSVLLCGSWIAQRAGWGVYACSCQRGW